MFHKHKHLESQISGYSDHNHKLASEPFLAFRFDRQRTVKQPSP